MPSIAASAGRPVNEEVKVISHPKLQKAADTWLSKIAEKDERERTQRLLQSLVAATQKGKEQQQQHAAPAAKRAHKPSGRLTMTAKGGHGACAQHAAEAHGWHAFTRLAGATSRMLNIRAQGDSCMCILKC